MAVIEGVVKNYQLVPYVSGTTGGAVSGTISSGYIGSFQLNGQMVQLRGISPSGIADGDEVRLTGERNSSGIFEVRYYFNSTRKTHSPPPELGFFRYFSWVFLCVGVVALLTCALFDILMSTDPIGLSADAAIGGNVVLGLLGIFFYGYGRRWKNRVHFIERKYQEFIRET